VPRSPELLAPVLRIVQRVITGFVLKQGLERASAGASLIQRFGSAAEHHLHCLVHEESIAAVGMRRCSRKRALTAMVAAPARQDRLAAHENAHRQNCLIEAQWMPSASTLRLTASRAGDTVAVEQGLENLIRPESLTRRCTDVDRQPASCKNEHPRRRRARTRGDGAEQCISCPYAMEQAVSAIFLMATSTARFVRSLGAVCRATLNRQHRRPFATGAPFQPTLIGTSVIVPRAVLNLPEASSQSCASPAYPRDPHRCRPAKRYLRSYAAFHDRTSRRGRDY
jgi:hypothetical protein